MPPKNLVVSSFPSALYPFSAKSSTRAWMSTTVAPWKSDWRKMTRLKDWMVARTNLASSTVRTQGIVATGRRGEGVGRFGAVARLVD